MMISTLRQLGLLLCVFIAIKVYPHRDPFIAMPHEMKQQKLPLVEHSQTDKWIKLFHLDAAETALILKSQTDLLSKSAQVNVNPRDNSLWIHEFLPNLVRIQYFLKKLDVPDKQILIEARIVNVDDSMVEELGLHLTTPEKTPLNTGDFHMSLPQINTGLFGLSIAKLVNNKLLDLELSALESTGRGTIIASPKLVTLNRKPAVIESGEEIPYQEQTASGATTITFKKAVLCLKVTPQLTPDHRILLQLEISQDKVSQLAVNGTPAVRTQELKTQAFVNNGQTLVLGGIFEESNSKVVQKTPFLSDVPLVGYLLRDHNVKVSRKELLIFVTPKVIENE